MKLKLVSDFRDYYDHWFDREGQEFRRITTEGPTRYQMFDLLRKAGFSTPPLFKLGKDLDKCIHFTKDLNVVVYLKPIGHRGEDKIFLSLDEAIEAHPGKWASLFVGERARSFRWLYIGFYEIILEYKSDDFYRSNVGDVSIEILNVHKVKARIGFTKSLPPLCAVDGTNDEGLYKAFDLNIAPGIEGSGVENVISAEDLANSLKEYISQIYSD